MVASISPSYQTGRVELGKVLPLHTPFLVYLDVSEVCNFRCKYCFRGSDQAGDGYCFNSGIMEWDTFVLAADQLGEFPEQVKKISLSNQGEPLVNRKLPDMVRYIKCHDYSRVVEIHTNASLLDRDYVLDLADSGIDRVIVSLQGLSAEQYRKNCGVEIDYNDMVENITLFYNSKKDNT